MKKSVRKIIFIAFIFTAIASLLMLNASADTTEYESCADWYFSELTGENVPYNYSGSCGYVAASMLLTYYDLYWNDNFVSSTYEKDVALNYNYTGIKSSTFVSDMEVLRKMNWEYNASVTSIEQYMTEDEYIAQFFPSYLEGSEAPQTLHVELVRMGIAAGYYDGEKESRKYSADIYDLAKVLDTYFDGKFGDYRYYDPLHLNDITGQTPPIKIKCLDSRNPGTSREEVIEKMYYLLDNNIPFIYEGVSSSSDENEEKEAHVMVAYQAIRDDEDNIVDCKIHKGYPNDTQTTLSGTEYNTKIGIVWFEIDESRVPHVCSDSYVFSDKKYCTCQLYGNLHPSHMHSYEKVEHDLTFHWRECFCGERDQIFGHNSIFESKDAGGTHYYSCGCGYSYTTDHLYRYVHYSNSLHRKICDACGDTCLESHHFVTAANPRYSRCHYCGYTRDEWGSGGSAVIMGKKEDEYDE